MRGRVAVAAAQVSPAAQKLLLSVRDNLAPRLLRLLRRVVFARLACLTSTCE